LLGLLKNTLCRAIQFLLYTLPIMKVKIIQKPSQQHEHDFEPEREVGSLNLQYDQRALSALDTYLHRPLDFVLYIGEGTLTEEMIREITPVTDSTVIFTCTVNKKISEARYSLNNPEEVLRILLSLVATEHRCPTPRMNRVTYRLQ